MSRLILYTVFHANLSYSYIPEDLYPQILSRCYWPLLRIIDEKKVPLGLEFPGYTLEVINRLDPNFIAKLRELWEDGLCEVIGSGYTQSIMPLIPSQVNRHNLRRGNNVYQELLGKLPTVAYVNELVYSASLPHLYHEAGYESLVVNWDSASPAQDDVNHLYRPCAVSLGEGTGDDGQMPVIWHYLEGYRDFQRYIEKEISWDTYLDNLLKHMPDTGDRAYPLYSSDWEVFDFKPWRVYPDGFQAPKLGEMDRLAGLLDSLMAREDIEFVTPSALMERFPAMPPVHPESAAYPLTYKKQNDHSMTRWAVSGRESVRFNTQCFQLYRELSLADWYLSREGASTHLNGERAALWDDLCYLWSSDFRTFTTEEKYVKFRNLMGTSLDRVKRLNEEARPTPAGAAYHSTEILGNIWLANRSPVLAESEPVAFTITANGDGQDAQRAYELHLNGHTALCQVTNLVPLGANASKLTLETLPALAVGQSGMAVVQPVDKSASSNSRSNGAAIKIDSEQHLIETTAVRLRLLPGQGGAIDILEFPGVSGLPLIGVTDDQVATSEITDATAFSGDLVLEDRQGRNITDRQQTKILYPSSDASTEIFIPIRCMVQTDAGSVWKTYRVYLNQPRVDLIYRFQWRDVVPKSFRIGRMALNPQAFECRGLYYATTNGGDEVEVFALDGQNIRQDEAKESGVTAHSCLGSTEGWVVVGDGAKGVGFVTQPAELYSVPLLHYQEAPERAPSFSLSLSHSLGEWDETSHTLWRGHSTWKLTILAANESIIEKTRACALLANGGIVTWNATNPS